MERMGVKDQNGIMIDGFEVGRLEPCLVENLSTLGK